MEKNNLKYSGLWPVMLTPFKKNKEIDFNALDMLTDFYISKGARGLFANCLSSEMYELSEEERLLIIRRVVSVVNKSLPVAATGTFGGDINKQSEFIKKVYDTGVDVVVLITSQLVAYNEDELKLKENILHLKDSLANIPLGLYECPVPYKRIISPELVKELAISGQFKYLKDTTCDTNQIIKKIDAVRDTKFSVFNANTPTALDSLLAGADGISPISANFYPEFYSWLFDNYLNEEDVKSIEYLNDQLIMMDAITRINYPMSAKIFLAKRGLKIETVIRTSGRQMNFEEEKIIGKMFGNFNKINVETGIRNYY